MRLRQTFFLLLLVGVSVWVNGQSLTDTIQIKEVKVLAKKKIEEAGLKITRPDSLARAVSLTTNLSEMISGYSPVFIKSYGRGSQATASFRGTAASHTQVLWNGMRLNSPMRGMTDLSLLPVFFTDDVYLLHGGSSLTEGSGGLGGSIHLNNKPDWNSRFNLKALGETGSFNSHKSFLKIMTGNRKIKSITHGFYETSQNDFPFYNSGVIPNRKDTLENGDYNKFGVLQEFYFRVQSSNIFSLRFWYQQSDRSLPQLMSYEGAEREEYQKDNQFRGQFEWEKYSDGWNFHFFTGVNSTRLNYFRATPAFDFVNEDTQSNEFGVFNHLRIFREISKKLYTTFSFDVNYFDVEANDRTKNTGYKEDRLETSLLLNAHFKPSDRLAAFVLLRSESYDRNIVPFVPSAGMEWQVWQKFPLVLRSNVARNYHKPTLNDLYWMPGGNPELLPEDGYTGDISLSGNFEFNQAKFQNEFTGFISKIENWIIWQPASNGAWYWEADNVKEVLSKGIEYAFSSEFEWRSFLFHSGANYAFTSTSNLNSVRSVDESRGKQLIYIPKHKGHFHFHVNWKKFSLNYDLSYVGKRYTKSSNRESDFERVLNPYWLSNLQLGKQFAWRDLTVGLNLSVENLLDNTYQSILWRPMPGRYYNLSVLINYAK